MIKSKEEDFLANFKSIFEEIDTSLFDLKTRFKENSEWDSMCALTLITILDDKYGIHISGDEIAEKETIGDVFNLIVRG